MTLTHSHTYRHNLHWARGAGCQISCNELRRHLSHSCSGVYSSTATFCSSSYLLSLTSITLNHLAHHCLCRPRPLLSSHLLAGFSPPSPFHSLSVHCLPRLLPRPRFSSFYIVASNHLLVKKKQKNKGGFAMFFLCLNCETPPTSSQGNNH